MNNDKKMKEILKTSKYAIDTFNKKVSVIAQKYNINVGEATALLFFYDNPNYLNAKDFVCKENISKAYVSKIINSLLEKKLINITENADKRFQNIELNEKSINIIKILIDEREKFSSNILKNIDDKKLNIFFEILEKVDKNIMEIEKGK